VDGVSVRTLESRDCAEAADVWWRSRTGTVALPAPVHTADEVRRWFADVLLPDGVLTLDGDELDQLYVVPEVAGQGIGSMLVDLAKALRPDGLALWAFQSNVAAREFYERRGFAEVRRTNGAANEERAPDVRLVWGNHPEGLGSRA
jgi:GNAT superfamily N-acetyltransferase